jgi:hypothetical protein
VKRLLHNQAVRVPIVMIAAVSWFGLSNHCVLAGIEATTLKAPMHCHGAPTPTSHDAPGGKDKGGGIECCKIVRATLSTPAKTLGFADELAFEPNKHWTVVLVLPDLGKQNGIFEWDTGPPGTDSFAESVLQRSLLAHAPPALA